MVARIKQRAEESSRPRMERCRTWSDSFANTSMAYSQVCVDEDTSSSEVIEFRRRLLKRRDSIAIVFPTVLNRGRTLRETSPGRRGFICSAYWIIFVIISSGRSAMVVSRFRRPRILVGGWVMRGLRGGMLALGRSRVETNEVSKRQCVTRR